MSVSAIVNAAGANFVLLGPADTMVKSTKPVNCSWCNKNRMRKKPDIKKGNRAS